MLSCDGTIFEQGRGFSDSLFVPSGYLFIVNEGFHRFEMRIPQLNVHADTTFIASSAKITNIEAFFDRKKTVITFIILYLDTAQTALRQPPNQSLKLTEPAVNDFAARCWTDLAHLIGTSAQQPTLRRLIAAAA